MNVSGTFTSDSSLWSKLALPVIKEYTYVSALAYKGD